MVGIAGSHSSTSKRRRVNLRYILCVVVFLGALWYSWWFSRIISQLTSPAHAHSVSPPDSLSHETAASPKHNGMSSCLLVMDDNHFLIEWIAMHYHVLPLRYLVIAVDPRSQTSPDSILDRWTSPHYTDLTIVRWNDSDYMTKQELAEAESYVANYFGSTIGTNLIRHRARQRMFYYKCMKHIKQAGRDWTLLTDSDEFLYINYQHAQQLPGRNPPPIHQPGSVRTFLEQELAQSQHNLTSPCIQIPRIRFGGMPSTPREIRKHVPPFVDPTHFLTLQWRKHSHPNDYGHNKISKVLVDVSRVPWEELQPVDSIHRPIRSMCGQRKLHIRKSQQVLVINHYLGSYEQFTFRDDSRKGKERSIEVSSMGAMSD